jgi:steroid delta-isomerase-like uncharacterized protein
MNSGAPAAPPVRLFARRAPGRTHPLIHKDHEPHCARPARCDANVRQPGHSRAIDQQVRFLPSQPTVHIDPRRNQMATAQATSNKATVRRFCDAANTGDAELISKTIDELVAPDALIRTPLPLETTGAQLAKELFAKLHRAYPDLHITIEDLIEEDDKVVFRNTVTGTHQGEYMGIPPTGKSVTYNEIIIARFAGGRIAETWGVVDVLSQMKQLGVIPAQRT